MALAQPTSLPSMPGTVVRLLQMFADPAVGVGDVVDIIKTDPALAGKMLKAANSSAVAASREVTDLKRAGMLLGKRTVSTLALSFSLSESSIQEGPNARLYTSFWHQSLITGVAASVLAKKFSSLRCDEAFLVGLLSRFGRLGAIFFAPTEYAACIEAAGLSRCNVDSICINSLRMNCEELTLQYIQSWKLPAWFIANIRDMHAAGRNDRNRTTEETLRSCSTGITPAANLRAAVAMGQFLTGENSCIALATLHELILPALQDNEEALDTLIAEVMEEFTTYADLLNVDRAAFSTPAEMHAKAMAQLTEVMLTSQPPAGGADQLVSEVEWLKDRLNRLSEKLTLDPMTSIHNRQYFESQLEKRIADSRLIRQYVGVMFLDINKFKQINDSYGHDVGDAAIRCVAQRLKQCIRNRDIVARYGGDEFVVLCDMNIGDGLNLMAQRIAAQTSSLSVSVDGMEVPVSVAIGGAIGLPDRSFDFGERLLRAADQAMYRAKKTGGSPALAELTPVLDTDLSDPVSASPPESHVPAQMSCSKEFRSIPATAGSRSVM